MSLALHKDAIPLNALEVSISLAETSFRVIRSIASKDTNRKHSLSILLFVAPWASGKNQ